MYTLEFNLEKNLLLARWECKL